MINAIDIQGLNFSYSGNTLLFDQLNLTLPASSRALLIGANGVGKSTLLRIIHGLNLVPPGTVKVFGRPAFEQISTTQTSALVDGDLSITIDLKLSELLENRSPQVNFKKEKELIEVLALNPDWRMNKISDGQRRRIQLCLALRKSIRLLLLDEVTSHLDVVARADFLSWLKQTSQNEGPSQGFTIVYTTHILDGLWDGNIQGSWPTHVVFMPVGGAPTVTPFDKIPEIASKAAHSLTHMTEQWIRKNSV